MWTGYNCCTHIKIYTFYRDKPFFKKVCPEPFYLSRKFSGFFIFHLIHIAESLLYSESGKHRQLLKKFFRYHLIDLLQSLLYSEGGKHRPLLKKFFRYHLIVLLQSLLYSESGKHRPLLKKFFRYHLIRSQNDLLYFKRAQCSQERRRSYEY